MELLGPCSRSGELALSSGRGSLGLRQCLQVIEDGLAVARVGYDQVSLSPSRSRYKDVDETTASLGQHVVLPAPDLASTWFVEGGVERKSVASGR